MREAWPIVRGRTRWSFSFISRERPLTWAVVEPGGDFALLGFFEAVHGFALLVEVAGVFDLGFHGLHLVAGAEESLPGPGPGSFVWLAAPVTEERNAGPLAWLSSAAETAAATDAATAGKKSGHCSAMTGVKSSITISGRRSNWARESQWRWSGHWPAVRNHLD